MPLSVTPRIAWCNDPKKRQLAFVMRAIHVRNAVTPGNLVANSIALNVREARHIAITSSVNLHMCMCMHAHTASMHWDTGDERKAENRPPRGCWGRAIFARSCARTRSPISSSSIELLYMKMHDNIPANFGAPARVLYKTQVHKQTLTRKRVRALTRAASGNGDRTWPKHRAPAYASRISLCFALPPTLAPARQKNPELFENSRMVNNGVMACWSGGVMLVVAVMCFTLSLPTGEKMCVCVCVCVCARALARPSSVFRGIEDLLMALNSKCARFMDLSEFLLLAVRARAHTHTHTHISKMSTLVYLLNKATVLKTKL